MPRSGEEHTSATQNTFDQVSVLKSDIGALAGMLETIISTGSDLANGTGWEGASRDRFYALWEGGGWEAAPEGASDVASALRTSILRLEDIAGGAETSATNITDADSSGAGIS